MTDALVFSLARLGPPNLPLDSHQLRFQLEQDMAQQSAMPALAASSVPFAGRVQADPSKLGGRSATGGGLLVLPQSFGAVYLGQPFAAIVTACNYSDTPVTSVSLKVELSTERSRVAVLYDSVGSPLAALAPGQRHDFVVKHDIKDLGTHSLACSAGYTTSEGERRVQGQAFAFTSFNPLVVRTKQRQVGDSVLLEAALENATKAPMLLDAITFLPSPAFTAERIGSGGASTAPPAPATNPLVAGGDAGPLSAYIQSLPLIPEGGSLAFLFRLTRLASAAAGSSPGSSPGRAAAAAAAEASGALGKMEIRWRGPMGELARLQTQQISLPPQAQREVSMMLARLPRTVSVGIPFTAVLKLQSHVDLQLGPLKVAAAAAAGGAAAAAADATASPASSSPARPAGSSQRSSAEAAVASPGRRQSAQAAGVAAAAEAGICLDGLQAVMVDELSPRGQHEVRLRLRALAAGQQALPPLVLSGERDGKQYAVLPPVEVFVDSA